MMGETLSHFEIVGEVAYGGLGRLHRARDERGGPDVALAVLPDSLRSDTPRYERLVAEARTASTLGHRNIAHTSAVETGGDREFVTIELVSGERLVDLMDAGPIPPERVLEIAKEVAEALARSHDKGLIHRDLKPANIILGEGGSTKMIDFGTAALRDPVKISEALAPDRPTPPLGEQDGSAPYMSPEQAGGMPVDIRSDIFSFGGLLYAMLTGDPPFTGKDGMAVMSSILQGPIPALPAVKLGINEECAVVLQRVLERSLSRDPNERYQSMREAGMFLPDAPDDPIRANLLADLRTARASLRPSEEEAEQEKSAGCLSRMTGAALALLLIALGLR
jgi:serine/threonine protein kinase